MEQSILLNLSGVLVGLLPGYFLYNSSRPIGIEKSASIPKWRWTIFWMSCFFSGLFLFFLKTFCVPILMNSFIIWGGLLAFVGNIFAVIVGGDRFKGKLLERPESDAESRNWGPLAFYLITLLVVSFLQAFLTGALYMFAEKKLFGESTIVHSLS